MALTFKTRLDDMSNLSWPKSVSKTFVYNGFMYYAYEDNPTNNTLTNNRIYFRTYNVTTDALSAKVDVSGAQTYGSHTPDMVRLTASNIVLCGFSLFKDRISLGETAKGFIIKESADEGATWPTTFTLSTDSVYL